MYVLNWRVHIKVGPSGTLHGSVSLSVEEHELNILTQRTVGGSFFSLFSLSLTQ